MIINARPAPDLPGTILAALPGAVQRQRDVFGRAAIDPLLANLRDRLMVIVAAADEDARGDAHQLAGFAGVLGFTDLATAWEGLSVEGESRRAEALRIARSTLVLLLRADLSESAD